METSGVNVVVSNNSTKQVHPTDRTIRSLSGFWYNIAFTLALSALILAIIAILKDEMTKLKFHSNSNGSLTEYCGWHNLHSDSSSSNSYSFTYSQNCGDLDQACTLEKIGTIWYALMIIGIVFGGIALIFFILDLNLAVSRLLIFICEWIFFGCMLANALIWGLYKTCHNLCNSSNFPGLNSYSSCNAKWGNSWILAIVAGGIALLVPIFLMMARPDPHKHY